MRIYGNRKILTVPGQAVRPTPSRVREAVFNLWRDRVLGCRWLDLCAGNGTMGSEALCRGAATVTGIERWRQACRVIQHNWQALRQLDQEITVLCGDLRQRLPQLTGKQFDCIYCDPPYADRALYDEMLAAIAQYHLLAPEGEVIAEYSPRHWTPTATAGLTYQRSKQYGETAIALFGRADCPPAAGDPLTLQPEQ